MNTESNKVLLIGIGETGLEVGRIIGEDEVKGIAILGIKEESDLKQLTGSVFEEAELVLWVADLGNKKENSLALEAATLAKGSGKVLAAFLTTPRLFEGEKMIMRALEAAQEINGEVDSWLIINKEAIATVPENGGSFDDLINSIVSGEEIIAEGIRNIMSLITEECGIKIDVQDLKTTLVESGTFTIVRGIGAGKNRIGLAVEMAMSSPLMKTCDISTARRVLIKVLAPKSTPLIMDEMNAVTEFVGTLPPHVDVKWGIGESVDNLVSVIILASGFDEKLPA